MHITRSRGGRIFTTSDSLLLICIFWSSTHVEKREIGSSKCGEKWNLYDWGKLSSYTYASPNPPFFYPNSNIHLHSFCFCTLLLYLFSFVLSSLLVFNFFSVVLELCILPGVVGAGLFTTSDRLLLICTLSMSIHIWQEAEVWLSKCGERWNLYDWGKLSSYTYALSDFPFPYLFLFLVCVDSVLFLLFVFFCFVSCFDLSCFSICFCSNPPTQIFLHIAPKLFPDMLFDTWVALSTLGCTIWNDIVLVVFNAFEPINLTIFFSIL